MLNFRVADVIRLVVPLVGRTGVLASGAVISQSILILSAPLLLRLYEPTSIGMLAAFIGLVSLLTIIACGRYELAIPLAKHPSDATTLVALCLFLLLIMSLLTLVAVVALGETLPNALGFTSLGHGKWLMPASLLAGGIYAVLSYWCIREESFSTIAKANAAMALTSTLAQLLLYQAGFVGLLIGHVTGQIVGALALIQLSLVRAVVRHLSLQNLVQQAAAYRNFPLYSTWEGFVNTASHQVAPLWLAFGFGAGATGIFAVAHRFMGIPASLLGLAVGQVFFASTAKQTKQGITDRFEATSSNLSLLGMPCFMLMALAAPQLVSWLFGAAWRETGELARWMAPWFYLQFISSPMSLLFSVVERQKDGMLWQWFLLLVRLIALGLGMASGSAFQTVIFFSIASAFAYLLQLIWLSKLANASLSQIVATNALALCFSILVVVPVVLAQMLLDENEIVTMFSVGVSITFLVVYEASAIYKLKSRQWTSLSEPNTNP